MVKKILQRFQFDIGYVNKLSYFDWFDFKGYCTEFNVAGGVIQSHAAVECNQSFPKCGRVYSSTESYKCTFITSIFHKMYKTNEPILIIFYEVIK